MAHIYKYKITKHAKDRLMERGTHVFRSLSQKAYEKGELLNDEEQKKMFNKGIGKVGYWSKEYRKYFGLIWVFESKRGAICLITVMDCV